MLDKYLSMQEDRLQEIGQKKREQQDAVQREENHLKTLVELRDSMPAPKQQSAYQLQQRHVMRTHLDEMIKQQNQKVDMARTDHLMQHNAMLHQYRKVKGFEILKNNREAQEAYRERRQEQNEADDWVSQSHRRN